MLHLAQFNNVSVQLCASHTVRMVLLPGPRPSVHRGKRRWSREDASPPSWCFSEAGSPLDSRLHGQRATDRKREERERWRRSKFTIQHLPPIPLFPSPHLCPAPIEELLGYLIDLLLHLHSSPLTPRVLSHFNSEHLKRGASQIQCQELSFLWMRDGNIKSLFRTMMLVWFLRSSESHMTQNGTRHHEKNVLRGLMLVTWSIRYGADMCWQHLHRCCGVAVHWKPFLHAS